MSATPPSSLPNHDSLRPSVSSVLNPIPLSYGANSFPLNPFADPYHLNSVVSISYKNRVGEGYSRRSPDSKSFPCRTSDTLQRPSLRSSADPAPLRYPFLFFCYSLRSGLPSPPIRLLSQDPRSPMQSLRLNPILNTDSYKLTH